MSAAEVAPNRPQPRIGRYAVTGRIGRGGMGMVYRGRDDALERDVAVKTLTAEGTLDDESRLRFGIEAKAAARLQHPNIVTIFELGDDRGLPFIAMELLPGADLETLLRSGEEMLLEERLDVTMQVCRGLGYAHEHGVVHRDMKPSNIRVLDDGRVKIMDFGIAKLGSTAVTKSGMMVGTVHYMSPEQIRGAPLDGRSDVFSVGVILYELLSGKRPFPGAETTQVLYRIVHEAPLPLQGDWGALTPRLLAIVDKALAKDPEQRYATATALADDLDDALYRLRREREKTGAPVAESEALVVARRLLAQGRTQDGLEHLKRLVAERPDELEARRALRTVQRELARSGTREKPDDFPELDGTLHAPPTLRATATVRQELDSSGPAPVTAGARQGGRGLLLAGITLVLALGCAAAVYLLRPAPAARGQRVLVRSQPPGAAILLDGRDTGVRTDGEVTLPERAAPLRLTLRKAGYDDATRELRPPFGGDVPALVLRPARTTPARGAVSLPVTSDPPGAQVLLDGNELGRTPLSVKYVPGQPHTLAVRLDGYEPRELALQPGSEPHELAVTLVPRGPAGSLSVSSGYPLDVLVQGRVLAKAQTEALVSLPAGRHTVTLLAPQVFLRATVPVQIRSGAATPLEAPGVGRLNVRATPDNCEVFINGTFADYPPILDRRVAAGRLSVTFKWPDGAQREQTLELRPGAIEYVSGRKD